MVIKMDNSFPVLSDENINVFLVRFTAEICNGSNKTMAHDLSFHNPNFDCPKTKFTGFLIDIFFLHPSFKQKIVVKSHEFQLLNYYVETGYKIK